MFSIAANAWALVLIRDVGVEQRQVELDVQRLFVELTTQVHAGFGRVDVLVQVEHQVVRHDRVARCEERDQTVDQVPLGGQQLALQVDEVVGEVDLLHRPGVADRVPVHVVELRIAHRPQRQVETGIQQVAGPDDGLGGGCGRNTGCGGGCRKVVGDCFVQRHVGAVLLGRGRAEDVRSAFGRAVKRAIDGSESTAHWHASQASGFSREQASASSSV